MLPHAYQLPAGLLLILAGLLACVAGYRLFRAVLTIYGLVIGALFASTLVAPGNVTGMLIALAVGGVVGALILYAGYFAGVVLVGAGFGAMAAHAVWTQWGRDPGVIVILFFAVAGGVMAFAWQRYAVIFATAFVGAQTAVAGFVALVAHRANRPTGMDEVWTGHLGTPLIARQWTFLAWIALGIVGALVQLRSGSPRRSGGRR
ncbi:MAG TPA: DUF4203 domain-containing protein [Vicinamibacterales bacterium]|jgi:hypothetical protein